MDEEHVNVYTKINTWLSLAKDADGDDAFCTAALSIEYTVQTDTIYR